MIATSDIKILSWLRQFNSTIFVLSLFHRVSNLATQPSFFSYYLCVLQAIAYQQIIRCLSFCFISRQTQALIIDEASMMSAKLLDLMNEVLKAVRVSKLAVYHWPSFVNIYMLTMWSNSTVNTLS